MKQNKITKNSLKSIKKSKKNMKQSHKNINTNSMKSKYMIGGYNNFYVCTEDDIEQFNEYIEVIRSFLKICIKKYKKKPTELIYHNLDSYDKETISEYIDLITSFINIEDNIEIDSLFTMFSIGYNVNYFTDMEKTTINNEYLLKKYNSNKQK